MELRKLATEEQKNKLRKMKTLPLAVKAAVYGGNIGGPGATMQFNSDIRIYNLWEALLYVEGYETGAAGGPYYKPGTALSGFKAALKLK